MNWISNSIKNRLFLALISFVVIIVVQLSLSFYAINELQNIARLRDDIAQVNSDWLKIYNNLFKYLSVETRNVDYFKNGSSPLLEMINRERANIRANLHNISEDKLIEKVELKEMVDSMANFFMSYESLMTNLESKVLEKGFKDFGIEGRMRNQIHQLEYSDNVPLEQVLAIRRNEKDYLLRGEWNYAVNAKAIARRQMNVLEKIGTKSSLEEAQILRTYLELFDDYIVLNNELGLFNDSGLKQEIEIKGEFLVERLDKFKIIFSDRVDQQLIVLRATLIFSAIGIVGLSIFLSLFFARQLTKPILMLSHRMKALERNAETGRSPKNGTAKLPKEIRSLTQAFNRMSTQISSQLKEIKSKNQELREQNQELETLNAELDKFIYHTSHDLRSPLTSVMGLLEIIRISENEEEKVEYLGYIEKCIEQLDGTIVDIIRFYKNRSTDILFEPLDFKQVVREVYEQNQFHPNAKRIKFEMQVGTQVMIGDPYRLGIVLKNLVSNAIKYHDNNKERQFISVNRKRVGENWEIHVSDNGQGIPKEHHQQIFDMFYRASDDSRGSGLGLYIVQDTIKQMGGQLYFESEEGEGTTFRIVLPLVKSKNSLITFEIEKKRRRGLTHTLASSSV